ncbi:hypothetical protein ACPPVV_03675 [Rhodanobacter sp. Col0626]|uniref:hypothetical protein n=1 Tax=Rhodanobacter sp. Col0626 TaxID=3415679 RepID=UPI003CEC7C9F
MKSPLLSIIIIILITSFATAHAQQTRHGVVTAIQSIDNRGKDETTATKTKRKIGGMLGGLGGTLFAVRGGEAGHMLGAGATQAGQQAGDNLAAKVGDQGPAAHYMVKLRLDGGKVLPTVQEAQNIKGLHEGSKVRVEGTGANTRLFAD